LILHYERPLEFTYEKTVSYIVEFALSIKAVVFDYGQVISLPQDALAMDRLAEKAGVERKIFETTVWALRGEYDRGVISARDYYKKVLSALGVIHDDKSIDEMIEIDLASWKNINEGTAALMEEVKAAGYTLGILSNMPHDFLAWARKNLPVFSLPHVSVFSCEENVIKPEKAIFETLLKRLGVENGELVFFDDNAENIESAAALGIKAFLWESPETARRELLALGVRLR
jgi:putative hydrolase of the HAD superfamily